MKKLTKLMVVTLMLIFIAGCSGENKSTDTEYPITSDTSNDNSEDKGDINTEDDSIIDAYNDPMEGDPVAETPDTTDVVISKHKGGLVRDMTSMEISADMGIGWNLGNTLEACGDWIKGSKVSHYETAWGNPITTKEMLDGIKAAGFNSVRIPVAWSNLIAEDYTINPELLDRVEEVANYVMDNDMYAVVNIHWDNGWFSTFSTEYDKAMEKYTDLWTQVSERFKDYSDYLILESLNEEGYYDDIWNRWSGSTGPEKKQAYDILNTINQKFVDIVRGSGSNNEQRHLLIAGYATDIYLTIDELFLMPEDPADHLMVSVHYYTPSTFTIIEEDADWGKASPTWGTEAEIGQMEYEFGLMKKTFIDKGIPVILGEYGATLNNKDPESVRLYITSVARTAYVMEMVPMLWDPGTHYSRFSKSFMDTELINSLSEIPNLERSN